MEGDYGRLGDAKNVKKCVLLTVQKYNAYPSSRIETVIMSLLPRPKHITPSEKTRISLAYKTKGVVDTPHERKLCGGDIDTFNPKGETGGWLNDEVIMCYLRMVEKIAVRNVMVADTFFYSGKLLVGGVYNYEGVVRWTMKRGVNVFDYDVIVVPLHHAVHWSLAVIYTREKVIRTYDSMEDAYEEEDKRALRTLKRYVHDEHKRYYGRGVDYELRRVRRIPQQSNGRDCGVFMCQYARCIMLSKDFDFDEGDGSYLRQKMLLEILDGKVSML